MSEFEGKKILFLHSGAITSDIVLRAKELGCKTIVANAYPIEQAPAKRVADESVDIDFSDVDAMVAMMKERHVDGIVTGYADSHLIHYYRLCKAMGFPCYCTPEQIEVTTNKLKFKELCRANGVPVVKEYKVSPEPTREELDKIVYPVMVKPADSSGARGCRPCKNEEELLRGISDALSYSKTGQVIVEKYMDRRFCDDIAAHYFFSHGRVFFTDTEDRYTNMDQSHFAPLTSALVLSSRHNNEVIDNIDKPLRKMFASIGVKEGVAFVQAFHDEEGFHVYEMGFRLGGGQGWVPLLAETEIDKLRALISFALGGKGFGGEPLHNINPHFNKYYCNLHFLCSEGTLSRVDGLEEVRNDPSVIHITQMHSIGDFIAGNGTLEQVLYKVYIQASTKEALMDKVKELRTKIVAYDENNKPMMLSVFNPDDIGTGNC